MNDRSCWLTRSLATVAALALVASTACSESSATSAPAPSGPPSGIVGQVFAGDIEGVKITASTEQGEVIATVDAAPGGLFGFDLGRRTGVVVLTTNGGTSVDLASGNKTPLPPLRTIVPVDRLEQPACVAQITPLTELAVRIKEKGKSWPDSTGIVTFLAAGGDAFCAPFVDPTKPRSEASPQTEAAIAMAGLSSLARAKGTSLDAAMGDVAGAIVNNDAAALDAYAGATEEFLSGPKNAMGLDAARSAVPSLIVIAGNQVAIPIHLIVPPCGATLPTNPAVPALGTTKTIACAKPNVTSPGVSPRSDVPRIPVGSSCGNQRPDACIHDEIDRCAGAYCIQATRPLQSRKVWKLCHWFTSPAECPGGVGVITKDRVEVPKACPKEGCDPIIVLVIPGDHNIDGSLIVHEKKQWVSAFQTAWAMETAPGFHEGERCPGKDGCMSVASLTLAKGEGVESRTVSFLTTYGYEWTMTFRGSRAVGGRTFCDVFTGVCVPEVTSPSSGGATCAGVCENLSAQCAPQFMNPKCVEECTARNRAASQLTCCANAKLPAGKCEKEGPGEVGSEDCDDDDVNCK